MRKVAGLILVLVFLSGCKSSFKSNFVNFNAYYNTFYNAKKNYNLGLEKSLDQARTYNTLQPIRIHQTPMGAGAQDFQKAIDKGADILRKFDESKWVDDALEIIGKSYYYRREYFSADQKFDELYVTSENPEMKQRAVFWKGRVLLELEAYNLGVQYLEEQLTFFDGEWKGNLEYEVQAVLAQHYIKRQNWVTALDLLNGSVGRLSKKEYKERGYFLIGQLNEILDDQSAAFAAYDKVESYYSEYQIQYEAKKKKAEVARALGDSDEAYDVFYGMVRDDKNTEFISQLNFELGKTEQDRGNYKKAEQIYLELLRDRRYQPQVVTKARTYNGLAEIYRFNYNDYHLAAVYYDSAAKVNAPAVLLPDDFEAKQLAVSFGEYSSLKSEIFELDSLLWLGSLPPEKFDSVLVEIERVERERLKRLEEQRERDQNTIDIVRETQNPGEQNTERNGFLNVKNQVMMDQASQQFRARWGERPLVDNWRVTQLLVNEIQKDSLGQQQQNTRRSGSSDEIVVSINLDRIPFTPEDQDSVREEISFLYYELANLFFLSLELPDSADYYFNKVLTERPQSRVVPVSMYSLSELNSIRDNEELARSQAQQLVNQYPGTVYADRLIEKYGFEEPQNVQQKEELTPREVYFEVSSNEEMPPEVKADTLSGFSAAYSTEPLASKALYDAIQLYIRLGMQEPAYDSLITNWRSIQSDWNRTLLEFQEEQDSASIKLSDTLATLSASDSLYYFSLLDSTLTTPDFSKDFPYQGTYWDSTRSKINLFTSNFSNTRYIGLVRKLDDEFRLPEAPVAESDSISVEEPAVVDYDYLSCTEISQPMYIRGGYDDFMETVTVPEEREEDEITFLFFVNPRGIVDEFQLVSEIQNQPLIDAFVKAIDDGLSFEPMLVEGQATAVSCEITFEIED